MQTGMTADYLHTQLVADVDVDEAKFTLDSLTPGVSIDSASGAIYGTEVADVNAPSIVCGAADSGWHADNVAIDCAAEDTLSGLADPADAAFSLSTSVPAGSEASDASTGSRQVCDNAGNCATAGPIDGNKIDRKAPTLSLSSDKAVDATSPAGALVSFIASATDGSDPSPSVSCAPASGLVFVIGASTVTCTATDHVGNTDHGSFTVTVRGTKEQLDRLIQDIIAASKLPPALKTQLLARLRPLIAAFDPSKPAQRTIVCNTLSEFLHALRLLSGHGIPPAQATQWITDATRIRAVTGC